MALVCAGLVWLIGRNGLDGRQGDPGTGSMTPEMTGGTNGSGEDGEPALKDGDSQDLDGESGPGSSEASETDKGDDSDRPERLDGSGTEGDNKLSEDGMMPENGNGEDSQKKELGKTGQKSRRKKGGAAETEPVEEVKGPPKIMIASDTHVLAKELMDGGTAFMKKMESDDGKTTAYSGEIVDALLSEALIERPDALILSGDLTFEGERLSHEELAGKLKTLQDAGVQVLVIPGNHDINNTRAAAYLDEKDGGDQEDTSSYRTVGSVASDKNSGDGQVADKETESKAGEGKDVEGKDVEGKEAEGRDASGESTSDTAGSPETGGNEDDLAAKDPAGPITAAEFGEIYQEFGYVQAVSRDENSLSYIYPLRDNIWLMMLDTNQYEPKNLVDGDIRPETYQWMIRELDRADEEGVLVVPVGHHNILSVSRLYTRECMIQSRASALWLFGEHNLPLYLSGHLHVQRMKKFKTEPGVPGDAYGVHEIVTSSLGMAPHQYGVLTWEENRQMEYTGRRLDVESYAKRIGSQDENLLNFNQYSRDWYYQIVKTQIYKKLHDYPEDIKQDMACIYADVLYHYGAGETMNRRDVETSRGYRMWDRLLPDSKWMNDIKMMLKDMKEN